MPSLPSWCVLVRTENAHLPCRQPDILTSCTPVQGETLSEEKEHAEQSNLLERAVVILDFEFLIDTHRRVSNSTNAIQSWCNGGKWATVQRMVYVLAASCACTFAVLFVGLSVTLLQAPTGSSSSDSDEIRMTFLDTFGTRYRDCTQLAASACIMSGLWYHMMTWCQHWERTKRNFLVLAAPGGWTTVSFVLAVVMTVCWCNVAHDWTPWDHWHDILMALAASIAWVLAEIILPENLHVPTDSSWWCWRRWWALAGKIPHDEQEILPYLHVLSPQEDETVTAPHTTHLRAYSDMMEEHLTATAAHLEVQIKKQVAALLRTRERELLEEMSHVSHQQRTEIVKSIVGNDGGREGTTTAYLQKLIGKLLEKQGEETKEHAQRARNRNEMADQGLQSAGQVQGPGPNFGRTDEDY
eukprot:COSAG02_NODE_1627_length_11587_cov_2.478238_3_plen_412_part_00